MKSTLLLLIVAICCVCAWALTSGCIDVGVM